MVKSKTVKKVKKAGKIKEKKGKKKIVDEDEEESSGGLELDDAFADDEDVSYAESKPKKAKKKNDKDDELEEELEEAEEEVKGIEKRMNGNEERDVQIKASKSISKVKKGDKIKVDDKEYEVDSHYVLIDHGTTKEIAIELFDKNDKDFQLRYFDDQVESTLDFYELQEIMYLKRPVKKIEW